MTGQSRFKGTMSFDALFSIIPLLLMFVFLLDMMSFIGHDTEQRSHGQDVFDRLVSIADYTVKTGAAKKDDKISYPNWIEEQELTSSYTENLRVRAGLSSLYISLEESGDYQTCIYRLVVTGEQKTIRRLFVCGG
jgi:hypothetical protein